MRYYKIVITDPTSGSVITPPGFGGLLDGASYTSYVNGQTLPGAWDIELYITSSNFAEPLGGGAVTIWGISRQEISQAQDLAKVGAQKNVMIYAGMQKGLPLANPAQAGIIAQGYIIQAFGNWIGTDMTLNIVIAPGKSPASSSTSSSTSKPTPNPAKNLVLNWKAGTPMADAIKSTLSTAYPGYNYNVAISGDLTNQYDVISYHNSLTDLAKLVKQMSIDITKQTNYSGVNISLDQGAFNVYDGTDTTKSSNPTQINFQDLIGQPTWVEPGIVAVKCVMRADIKVGSYIMLPQTLVTNTAASLTSLSNQSIDFNGSFLVQRIRHNGHFRQPDASSWVTDFQVAVPPGQTASSSSGGIGNA